MFDRSKFDAVCLDMANGLSLRKSCIKHGLTHSTFILWLKTDDKSLAVELTNQYARAREDAIEAVADEWLDIVDEEPEYVTETASGREETTVSKLRIDPASVANKKLRADARQWYLSKLAPKKFGDKVSLDHSGEIVNRIVRPYGK